MERSRFGELAVAAGYLTPEKLAEACRLQERDAAEGRVVRPLGIICMQLGHMSFKQVSLTLERSERKAGRHGRGFPAERRSSHARPEQRERILS